jgi:hypothetical protein
MPGFGISKLRFSRKPERSTTYGPVQDMMLVLTVIDTGSKRFIPKNWSRGDRPQVMSNIGVKK